MFLTGAQARHFKAHLRAAEVSNECPVCHADFDLTIGAEPVGVLMYTSLTHGTSPVRMVRCVCPRCAAVTMFDAVAIDIQLPER